MKPLSGKPQLSVIIASYNSGKTIQRCLASLKNQITGNDFEIIVVDSSGDEAAGIVRERFPEVRLYKFPDRKYAGEARNFGISVAGADILAFIDADCTADRNWVDEILKAHQSDYLAIGGSIANGNPYSYVGWAAYFCEFSQWMPGEPTKWLGDISAANMSYKKKAFGQYGRFIEGTYCSDTDFHLRLGRGGTRLRFIPSIHISH